MTGAGAYVAAGAQAANSMVAVSSIAKTVEMRFCIFSSPYYDRLELIYPYKTILTYILGENQEMKSLEDSRVGSCTR
jgi:hypothetical protein